MKCLYPFTLVAVVLATACGQSLLDADLQAPEGFQVEHRRAAIRLYVDRDTYAPEDTIRVTLENNGTETLFLEGCSQFTLATRVDSLWEEKPLVICVWAGTAVPVEPGTTFRQTLPAKAYSGTHKFRAPIYFGCRRNAPISTPPCVYGFTAESQVFIVSEKRFSEF